MQNREDYFIESNNFLNFINNYAENINAKQGKLVYFNND